MRKICQCKENDSCSDCGKYMPDYASEITFVPMNWEDRDQITGKILTIIEASVPEGNQQNAIKDLIKETTKKYWIDMFNYQFDILTDRSPRCVPNGEVEYYELKDNVRKAIWNEDVKLRIKQYGEPNNL